MININCLSQDCKILAINKSFTTSCAEDDNINIPIFGNISKFKIEATHPVYPITIDNCDANFLWAAKHGLVVVLHGWADVFTTIDTQQFIAINDYFVIKDEHKKNVDQVIENARQLGQILVVEPGRI